MPGPFMPDRPHTYKLWDEQRMAKAVHGVIVDKMSIRQTSLQFGVPKSTLGDRASGLIKPGAVSGPPKIPLH